MSTIVALDIETTGLDPQKDSILEIGAVRFNGRRVEDEWSTLINPGRPIPAFITQLTGITNQMVIGAPSLRDVLPDLEDFVGDAPIVGHSVGFDMSFLRRNRVLQHNDTLDTYELASILLPRAGRYNLGALAQTLAVPLPATHRALDDARACQGVYVRLNDLAMELPVELLAEIIRLGDHMEWGGSWTFHEAYKARSKEVAVGKKVQGGAVGPLFGSHRNYAIPPLTANQNLCKLDPEEVAGILQHGGAFSRHFPNFEHRPQQVEMLKAVTKALSNGQHLMVEASTGVGKSVAYLVPAALWAMENNCRVVISTNTINLQEQLIKKDIPDVRQALEVDLQATVLKGRSNYLCPRRLESFRRHGPENATEMRVLAKILVWLQSSTSGDRGEINLNGPLEREVWMRLSAEDESCTSENCMQRTGGACPFYQARMAAQSSHLLVVNHALLLADVATGNRVLPEYDYVIIDEAHHLEEATTNALSFQVTTFDIERALRSLGGSNSGAIGRLLTSAMGSISPSDYAALHQLGSKVTDLAFQLDHSVRVFFNTIEGFLLDQRDGKAVGLYAHQERILPATRSQPAWGEVEVAWDDTEHYLKPLVETIGKITQGVAELIERIPEDGPDIYGQLSNIYRRFQELLSNINAFVFKPAPETIYWAEVQPDGRRLSLHIAPVHIGLLMQKHLWHEKVSVVLTSATLSAAGEFDYLRGRLLADEADELALGSPFDYEQASLLYLADDIPEPTDRIGYQRAVERSIIQLCQATGGRALVLFTSYSQLRATSNAIGPALNEHGIIVFEQGEGASPHTLLENFRTAEKAVLLGTRAFWEGVDVPGDALSVVIITKLPFDVPSDPIIAARAETFEDSFNQYQLPEAILRFRQGFGRLIRSQSDRGVVAILDKRVLTKRYGKAFIDSLPVCTIKKGPLSALPKAAAQWLNL